jgi:hypothetical protein
MRKVNDNTIINVLDRLHFFASDLPHQLLGIRLDKEKMFLCEDQE